MKTLPFIFTFLLFCSIAFCISIEEAYTKGLVEYEIKGTSEGHTGACIAVHLKNISAAPVNLEIETGRILEAADSNYQNMLVTKRFFVRLQPGQKSAQNLYALCAEPSDATPNNYIAFAHGKMSGGVLFSMAKFVEAQNLQNSEGQNLVWEVVKGNLTFSTCDLKPQIFASLKTHFASDKNVKFENCNTQTTNGASPAVQIVKRFSGSFGFSLSQASDVEISLFDSEGNKVKQLVFKKQLFPDYYDYEYQFTTEGLEKNKTYELKLLINGKPKRVQYVSN